MEKHKEPKQVEVFDNINKLVKDDLKVKIKPGSKVSISAACFGQ